MLSAPIQRPPLTGWQTFGLYFAMVTTLSALTLTTPTVLARSTSLASALVWVGPWTSVVLTLVLLSWWVARRTGVGVRDGYGIAPRWARSERRLVRTEHALDTAITAGVALSVYLTVYAFTWLMNPTPTPAGGWLPVVLFTQTATAVASELVLLGVLAAVATALKWGGQTFVLVSMTSRIAIADPHWSALLASAVGGAFIAALYLHTRRLTPILIAHTTAATSLTLMGAWASSLT
ncbi:hypothetical protein NE857_03360 [Nocardiopsis exhalans]|uniref:CPBP family intramembrane metalloprotease n=1 Tax=Nocardiopsis exhalans TaxID=163604 RepID=A0ABY5DBW3_9ACTN|nr:hypothetical protein [Nocardiopsis exhalans]USY20708.1 hypothetical protein NE857_03360 [Nocardiopsis exhalans]